MTNPLAEMLHRETWRSHNVPRESLCGFCQTVAARLRDAGVRAPADPPIVQFVRGMLDGRENDEQITVEVSLLWSLIHAATPEDPTP